MFREHAPEECIEAGIRNPRECGIYMFKQNAPEECIEAGLTGENRNDPRKCEEIMRKIHGERGEGPREFAPAFGFRCREIKDPNERLKCFDDALSGVEGGFEGRADFDREGPSDGWPEQCQRAQALTRESCEQVMKEFYEGQQEEFRPPEEFERPTCGEGQRLECFEDNCRCVDESFIPPEEPQEQEEPQTSPPIDSGTSETSGTSESSGSSESGSGGESGGGITGGVIAVDNNFLDYYFKLFSRF